MFFKKISVGTFFKNEMEVHLRTHFPNMAKMIKMDNKPNENKSMCSECGRLFQCAGNLSKHIRRVHLKQRYFSCDLCK